MPGDYYFVLGVSMGADQKKIRDAYREVAKKYHPDSSRSEDTAQRFREVQEAYETLSDKDKREKYDQELKSRGEQIEVSIFTGRERKNSSMQDSWDRFYSDTDEFFGGVLPGFFESTLGRQKDLYLEIVLSPVEAFYGCSAPVTVPVWEPCPQCNRSGLWEEFFCPLCFGKGRVKSQRSFQLVIPPRVQHGTETRVPLEDIGLENSTLYVTIFVDPRLRDKPW